MTPDVSVVIPTLGRATLAQELARALSGLLPPPTEIIVVFQEPSEYESALAARRTWTSEVPLRVEWADQRSVTTARNRGAARAVGTLVAFIDDDCCPESCDWLSSLCGPLLSDPRCVGATGPVLGWDAAGGGMRFGQNAVPVIPLLCHPIGDPRARSGSRASTVWGGNFAVRRAEFLAVGGFRSDVFESPCIYEETDLSLRLTDATSGHLTYVPAAAVIHEQQAHGGQRASGAAFSPEFLGRHKRKLIQSIYGRRRLVARLSLLLNASLFGARYLLTGGPAPARSFLRGLLRSGLS